MLKQAGELLFGPQYRSELARQLGVHLRTVMRWDAGGDDDPGECAGASAPAAARRAQASHRPGAGQDRGRVVMTEAEREAARAMLAALKEGTARLL